MPNKENLDISNPRNLRPRKEISYKFDISLNESEDAEYLPQEPNKREVLKNKNAKKGDDSSDKSSSSESDDDDDGQTSELIRKREDNIRERMQILSQLGFDDVKKQLKECLPPEKPKVKKGAHVKRKPSSPVEPSRKSLRLQGIDSDGKKIERAFQDSLLNTLADDEEYRKPSGAIQMELAKFSKEQFAEFLNTACDSDMKSEFSNLQQDLDAFKADIQKLQLTEDRVNKVTPSRVFSLAFHPSESKLLLAVGGKNGEVGFWDVEREDDSCIEVFSPHSRPVNCSSFCDFDSSKLYTTSYDGTVRRADLNKLVFDDIYASDPQLSKNHTTWHCQKDDHTLMVAHGFGSIGFVDVRSSKIESWLKCHRFSIRTVDKHPLQPNYIATASGTGQMRLWDIRNWKGEVFSVDHPKSLSGAFFSKTGSYLLVTCYDDKLRIYNTKHIGSGNHKVVTNTKHNNQTGRWLTPFKARWHPQREDAFIVGSMNHPRGIDVYGIHGAIMHRLESENMTTICSVNVFHPSRNVIAGGNSSGKVHVFM